MKKDLINIIKNYQFTEKSNFLSKIIPETYTEKILKKAMIITYYDQGLKGFIAFYANNFHDKIAFLSLILIDARYRGKGISDNLLAASIKILLKNGFEKYFLEVDKENLKAIHFYKKHGFKIVEIKNNYYLMMLKIQI